MPTLRYRLAGPNGFNADITIVTENTTRNYSISGVQQIGYAILSASGTLNGQSVELLPSNNQTSDPRTNDPAANGNIGQYDNVYFLNDDEGNADYSHYGIDNRGLGIRVGGSNGVDYKINVAFGTEVFRYTTDNTNNGYTNFNSAQVTTVDGNGNETAAACYVTGTRILTARGQVRVEDLVVGDLAVTASGQERPIRWIGHQTLRCRGRASYLPVRIAAGAFGEGRPARDLMVSPGHTVCVDVLGEVLIPAIRLVNGTTITQVETAKVTYWHVELESHDILLAEGLPAESYLDMGNRAFFEGAGFGHGPDTAVGRTTADFCRPFHEAGPVVELVRARLDDRAVALGWHKVEETFAKLHLVADGRTIRPDVQGLTARFVVPADVRNVRLISETSVPAHVVPGSSDDRRLGVALAALTIDDGLIGARSIALDDARLDDGFHAGDDGARWTDGSAVLPADLWAGCKGSFFLRMELAGPALPRWIAPGETAGVVNLADRRMV